MKTSTSMKIAVGIGFALTLILASASTALAADSVAAVRELYASAAYTEALTMLDRMTLAKTAQSEGAGVQFYRGLCLLALGKSTEASHAFEALVAEDPMYRPADSEVPPRVHSALTDVRRRLLPGIVQQRYAEAKAAYDRKEYRVATVAFEGVLLTLGDPDIASIANQSPLADLKMLATGFFDLSSTALAAATTPVAPTTPPPLAVQPSFIASNSPASPRIRTSSDAGVVAPIALSQTTPTYPGKVPFKRVGAIEIVIDESGAVESAVMRTSIDARYDQLLISSARAWKYKPATMDGVPTKFRRLISIAVTPQTN
jgi:hypothetical protein